jgi:hypothetical protein
MSDKRLDASDATPASVATLPDTTPRRVRKSRCKPPIIDDSTRLKWGLALLGKDKADQYLAWLRVRLSATDRYHSL